MPPSPLIASSLQPALVFALFLVLLFVARRRRRTRAPAEPRDATSTAPPTAAPVDPRPIEPDPVFHWARIAPVLLALILLIVKYESVVRLAITLTSWRLVEAGADSADPPVRRGAWVLVDTRTSKLVPGEAAAYRVEDAPPVYGFARIEALGPDTLARTRLRTRSLDGPDLAVAIGPDRERLALRRDACTMWGSAVGDSGSVRLVMRRARIHGRMVIVLRAPESREPGHGRPGAAPGR